MNIEPAYIIIGLSLGLTIRHLFDVVMLRRQLKSGFYMEQGHRRQCSDE